ncbi:hypothetical protein AM588_10001437 [Phytophthora nicotianae]|uniref:Amidohydrolase-related domain-containing protein n=1 Tax=Phytophthora nicotianae TaxID=4792 RepID=A0A0W8CT51_PHYNI|nr:hypothetical protein AM588_10001437 [Phytophthora nicotianae]
MTHIIAYKANVVHSVALGKLQVLQPGLVGVNEHGKIVFVLDLSQSPVDTCHFDKLVDLGEQLLLPGFIDGHAHAPQYSFIGVGMHLPLLQWLETYTFPYESKFQNLGYAKAVYEKAVRRHLNNGTTTCSKNERELLREKQTAVIHCPNSNFSLSSGVLNVRRLLNEGIKVGLGTDVSGGYSPSMLDAIRQAVIASKLVSIGNGSGGEDTDELQHEPLSFAEAFHLATVGSAEALGLSDKVGNFMVGKDFDALVIDPYVANSPIDEAHDPVEGADVLHTFQKFLFLGDDRNIVSIFVGGRQVKSAGLKPKDVDVTSSPLTPGSVHPTIQPLSLTG